MFEAYNSVHEKTKLAAVFLCRSKAFETVSMAILSSSLDHIGVRVSA